MPETTILLGPWAPDHPAYGGNKIASGGSVIVEDAKGVYPTLGGYRPLVGPGTAVGAFTNADFAEFLSPNTLDSAYEADIWLDFDATATIAAEQIGVFEYITQIDNRLTGASNHATSLYQVGFGSMEYVTIVKLPVGIGQTPIPSVNYVGSFPGAVYSGTTLVAGNAQGGAMDIDLSAAHTGTTLWFCAFVNENFYTDNSNNPDTVLLEFGNDGEVAENNADSAVLRRDGTNLKFALVRSGDATEEAVQSSTYGANRNVIVSGYFDGTNKKLRVNGTEVASELSSGAFDISRIRIGGRGDLADGAGISVYSACWQGQIHWLVVGTGAPDDALMEQLEGAVAHSKAVTSLLPSGHTYKTEAPQSSASTTGANEPTSEFMCWSKAGSPYFFVGDYSKIWLLNQAGATFDDVSNASTVYLASKDLPWQFAQFGNRVIAVTKNNAPQYYELGTSALFADLPGTPPNARAVAQVRDFLFLGSVTEVSDGELYEYRVRWSGFNDSEDWTTDPGGTQADFQDLDAQFGEVMAIVGGEYATVFQQRAITRFTYVGPPAVWQRDTLEINRGTIAPLSVIQIGRMIYYYSHDGFWAFDGAQSHRISGDQIHRWVENRLSEDTAQQMRVGHDPDRRIIVWAWPYDPDGANRANSGLQLIFNYESGQWSYNIDTQKRWWIVRAPPVQNYIDASEELIDDSSELIDTEGANFARTLALNYDGELWRLSSLDGGDIVSRIETAKLSLTPGYRTFVTEGRIIGNVDSDATITIAVNSNPAYPSNTLAQDAGAAEVSHNSVNDGFFAVRSEGRYHSFMVQFDGGKGATSGDLEELLVVQGLTLEYRQRGKH